MSNRFLTSTLLAASVFLSSLPAFATPLDSGSWFQIARAADDGGGVFDGDTNVGGNGGFDPTYSFGTFTSADQQTDFYRPFQVFDGMDILFITGDLEIWALTSFATLRAVLDAGSGEAFLETSNITFDTQSGPQEGNIVSRITGGHPEDPWIGLLPGHFQSVDNGMIIWGENDFAAGGYEELKNTRGGVNVFVSVAAVPLPASLALLASGLGALGATGWIRRRRRPAA